MGRVLTRDVPLAPEIPPRAVDAHRGRTSRLSADQRERTPPCFLLSHVSVLNTDVVWVCTRVVRDRCHLFCSFLHPSILHHTFFLDFFCSPAAGNLLLMLNNTSSVEERRRRENFILAHSVHSPSHHHQKVEKGRKRRVPNTTTPPHTFSSLFFSRRR